MKVLVLGANGFIGRHLLDALAATPDLAPVAASRRPQVSERFATVQLDATQPQALAAALNDVGAVINCIAGAPATMTGSAQALRDALMDRPAVRLIHFSSMAAYGSVRGDILETTPLRGDLGGYSQAKAQCESILAPIKQALLLRPGCVYGPGGWAWSGMIAQLLRQGRIGDLGPAGAAPSNLVHVDDVVTAVLQGLRHPEVVGPVNLAMRDAPTWNTYFSMYAQALGLPPLKRVSAARLWLDCYVAGSVMKALEMLNKRKAAGSGQPVRLPPSVVRLWRQDLRLDPSRAEQWLGVHWRPLQPALQQMAAAAQA
ncbi:NAD-dependent epimerase/dehydratase family protein [Kerstersia sp.]|uniref:NAD-dependent epimerase/dehydratase family protein n=1 Tax=Kerstersia sp. TaxID=1930783 RepID=UPI003F93F495